MKSLYEYCVKQGDDILLRQWHPTKNGELCPEDIAAHSHKKVWWACEKRHEWEAALDHRTLHKTACPYCAGMRVITRENDLRTLYPEIANQWHPVKNGPLRPEEVMPKSNHKAWWACEKGHEWQAPVYSRTAHGRGCPYCSGLKVLIGFNDLTTVSPKIAAQWHRELNGDLTPEQVAYSSNKKAWWICEKGHEWSARIVSRTGLSTGCPYCTGRKVLVGFNDLATVEPKIAAQWHRELNGDLTPEQVTTGCTKKVWWVCSEGHVWKAVINSRAGNRKRGCPVCAGNVRKDRYKDVMDEIQFKDDGDRIR